jgi:plasmid stabilization system protein ParE
MRVRWTPAAAADLEQIKDYLTEHMPERLSYPARIFFDTNALQPGVA